MPEIMQEPIMGSTTPNKLQALLATQLALFMASYQAMTQAAHTAVLASRNGLKGAFDGFSRDVAGALQISQGLGIAGAIIGAVVGISILAALIPTWFGSLASIGENLTDPGTTTGNTDADALLPVFGLLIAFAGIFAIVGLVVAVVRMRRG